MVMLPDNRCYKNKPTLVIAYMPISYRNFLQTLPETVIPQLPANLQGIKVRQAWRYLIQFHYGEPGLHYEVSGAKHRPGWEVGFHCEARDKRLDRHLLDGFRRHLFEIKDQRGHSRRKLRYCVLFSR